MQNPNKDFQFGIEAEYLLVDADTYQALWYQDLSFKQLDAIISKIDLSGVSLEGLSANAPHSIRSPYIIEGYHVYNENKKPISILPKGIEIRTPKSPSLKQCLALLQTLHHRLSQALFPEGLRLVALSHHPSHTKFEGPQNSRTHEFWGWAKRAMLTYGPDFNVSIPHDLLSRFDWEDFHAKLNYYAPALTAFSVASPFYNNALWTPNGVWGHSVRTFYRREVAPVIEYHPSENHRLEFKPMEMSSDLRDFENYFLIWLTLLLDDSLEGRASDAERLSGFLEVALNGLDSYEVRRRNLEVLNRASKLLPLWGFNTETLSIPAKQLDTKRTPANTLQEIYLESGSIEEVLIHREKLVTSHTETVFRKSPNIHSERLSYA